MAGGATLPPGRRRMEDVAPRAGVSQMTVSRALRTPEKVSPATRDRIAAAVAELDYVLDLVAGGLATRRSRLVAVIVSTLENSIFAATVQGLAAALRGEGYAVLPGASDYSREGEEQLLRAVLGRRPDGIVLTDYVHTPAARRLLDAAGVPVVETWELPEAPIDAAVGFSNLAAGRAMTLALHGYGYRRIAFLGTAADDDRRGRLRREGYRAALAELGAGPPREVELPAAVAGLGDGPRALEALLAAHGDSDAAFCVVDALAAGLLLACRRRGVDVPGRLAVAGFGDFDVAHADALDITTVRVPGRAIGAAAGEILLARMRGEGPPAGRARDVGFEVVRRGSA
jgi:LacI family transcriptional regulator, gluconate utilization system Gnt-I transcriptional repressor